MRSRPTAGSKLPGHARRRARKLLVGILLCLGLASAPNAIAHFKLNLNVRIFHVEHRADGLELFVRMPMPYLVADRLGPPTEVGLPEPAPFTSNRMEGERLVHFVDWGQLGREPLGLGRMLVAGLKLEAAGETLPATAQAVRVHPLGTEPGFATLYEAIATFDSPQVGAQGDVYVGDAVVDVHLRVTSGSAINRYRLSSTLDPGLPDQDDTANLLLDYWPGESRVFRATGLLAEPIEVSRSRITAFNAFVREGVRHILEGADHVLFVVCLVVGAAGLARLLWRVTGFTLGHSVTLTLGFFGFVPSGDWFVPTVELIIALTIIFAAIIALRPRTSDHGEIGMFAVTAGIGLIHGLGFSFVLKNILKVSSPDIWQSLLAFNVGIELGQLLIVAVAAFAIWLAARAGDRAAGNLRKGLAAASIAVAAYWVLERSLPLASLA